MINVAAMIASSAARRAEENRRRRLRNSSYRSGSCQHSQNAQFILRYPARCDTSTDKDLSVSDEQRLLKTYFHCPQDWHHEYWQDQTRTDLYLIAYYNDMPVADADKYVRLYDLFGVFVDIEKFQEINERMNEMEFHIFDARDGNIEYKVLKGLIEC